MSRFGWLLIAACNGDLDFDEDGWLEPKDCDDGNPLVHPEAEEVAYDDIDQDCDGTDLVDRDEDGFQAVEAGGPDCNDLDPDSYPGAREIPYDGVDQNCDDWNDFDFDLDGYEAMGQGGDDCDDNNPVVFPIDIDGDGYSPCTGDCDESDPLRNEEAEPFCGNGFDDDCDEISDCTLVGVLPFEMVAVGLIGVEGTTWLGAQMLAPGDLDGDGVRDILFTTITGASDTEAGERQIRAITAEMTTPRDETEAWASIAIPQDITLTHLGDIDLDGRPDLIAASSSVGLGSPTLWLFSDPPAGDSQIEDLSRLILSGAPGEDVGTAVDLLDDHLAVGAPGISTVQILPVSLTGERSFGDDGATIVGAVNRGAGAGLLAYDADGDGTSDLVIAEQGDPFGFGSGVYLVTDPPRSGSHSLDSIAQARIDTRSWGQTSFETTAGDLNGDGTIDGVIGAPFASNSIGAILVLTAPPEDGIEVDDMPVQRLGLGDDTLGWALLAEDFDGDGSDDLIAGAPAAWGGSGGAYKPGALHLWYGPIAESVDHTNSANLLIQGSYLSGFRTFNGYALALEDVDGDTGRDLLFSVPLFGTGQINVLPGGLTGLYGF